MCLQIAVGETEKAIDAAWFWIEKNMMPELETIDHPLDKERWVSEKINMIVTEIGKERGGGRLLLLRHAYPNSLFIPPRIWH